MLCEPVVAFSINCNLLIVFGAMVNVLVVLNVADEVTLKYIPLAGSEPPSSTVSVASASEEKQSFVVKLNPSPIN